jgi:NitT/TauT family transport system permease protein
MYKFDAKLSRFRTDKEGLYRIVSILSPLLVLVLWEVTVRLGILDYRFFPTPTTVMGVLFGMVKTGEIIDHLAISLQRITLGFVLGAVPGIILGLLMGWSKGVRAFLDPLVAALYPIPKVSLLPLILIIFGIGETSKVVVIAIAGFFMVLITTAHGVMRIDPILVQAGQNYGARGWKLFSKVILPASLPSIFTGLRLALGICLLIIVAAEFVAANKGIGYLIWISWSTLSVGKMYAGLVVIGALGLIFTTGLERLGKALMPWAEDVQNRTR